MSYIPIGLSAEQARQVERTLDMESVQKLDEQTKIDLLLRRQQVAAEKQRAFWEAVSAFALSAGPLLALLGVGLVTRSKK